MPTSTQTPLRKHALHRPKRVKPEHVDVNAFKKHFGGCFPTISGRKYRYPSPHDEERWVCLIARALSWDRMRVWCTRVGRTPPPAQPKFSYILYHARPEQKMRRSKRNKHRRELGAPPGTEVHHQDQKRLSLSSAVVISEAEHDHIHAAKHKKAATPIKLKRKTKTPLNRRRSSQKPRAPAARAVPVR
jgi:hypothetical protein